MTERGIPSDIAERLREDPRLHRVRVPESHAQSFAHLVYASAYLKRHYPAAFTAALVRNQPMGFYSPQSLLADAKHHGVVVRGVDINASDVHPTLEEPVEVVSDHPHAPGEPQ